jgi:hypothetical protein
MRFCKTLAIMAVIALAMVGPKVAKADSGGAIDPHAKLTVPTDPGYQSCADVIATGAECFTENDSLNPVEINGPTAQQIAADPNFDIVTNFFYEPDCGANNSCTTADTLQSLFFYFSNSIPGATYGCTADTSIPNPAFNACAITGIVSIDGVYQVEAELTCSDSVAVSCTGMLPGYEGTASVTPEPGTLLLLAAGLPLLGLLTWKRRKALNLGNQNQAELAVS